MAREMAMTYSGVPVGEQFRFKSRVMPYDGTQDSFANVLRRGWEKLKSESSSCPRCNAAVSFVPNGLTRATVVECPCGERFVVCHALLGGHVFAGGGGI